MALIMKNTTAASSALHTRVSEGDILHLSLAASASLDQSDCLSSGWQTLLPLIRSFHGKAHRKM